MKDRTMWLFTGILAGACICILLLASISNAAVVNFSWLPNSESNLKGYKVYYGSSPRDYSTFVDVGMGEVSNGRIVYTIPDAPEGNTFYAVTAYDDDGLESDYSNEISFNPPPKPPLDFNGSIVTVSTVTTTETTVETIALK